MIKKIFLNVSSFKFPINLKIFSAKGFLIKEKTIYSQNSCVCFCSCSPYLILKAAHKNQTNTKYIDLFDVPCQKINVFLNFVSSPTPIQNFWLFDANYFLPIPSATLRFL